MHLKFTVHLAVATCLLALSWSGATSAGDSTAAATVPKFRVHRYVRVGRYHQRRTPYDVKTDASYQCSRLILLSGDIELNPGPNTRPTNNKRRLSLALQNVQSIKNKLGDLRQSAPSLQKFSIVALTETWLNSSVDSSEIESALPSHILHRRDRIDRVGGGVACLIESSLSPVRREDLETDRAEMMVVEIKSSPALLLAVCYCPPDDSAALTATMAALHDIAATIPSKAILALGDFNVPEVTWETSDAGWAIPALQRRSRRAVDFLDGCQLAGLWQHVTQPTRGHNFLDLVLTSGLQMETTVRDGTFPSDHLEVVCEFWTVLKPTPLVTRSTALNYKRADWDGMRAALRLVPWSLLDDLPVDEAADKFYDLLTSVIRDYIPTVTLSRRHPPWFDRDLRAALARKEAAHRALKRRRTPETEAAFRENRRTFKQLAGSRFYDYLKGLIGDLKTNPKRFWTFLKCLKGKKCAMTFLMDGNRKITSDLEKASLLNRTFAAKFTDPHVATYPPITDYSIDRLTSFDVHPDTVKAILESLNRHKACGPDNISARVIRECADELTVPVTKICKMSLEQGVVPRVWKQANVVPILKKGCKTCPKNYRSVSLLPLFSKVLERVVYISLFNHVRPVLSTKQHGFLPGRSCASNLGTMLHSAWSNVSAGSQTDVIYTDYSSAFQSVNHKLLIKKLEKSYHIADKALAWCKSYLTGREQRVIVNGQCSPWVPVTSGTPEGGQISPLLFALFINDLPEAVRADCVMFADDVKLYHRVDHSGDTDFLQADLDRLYAWSKSWGLALNPSKCKILTLSLRRSPIVGTYVIDGTTIERVTVMRDLGVLVDVKLTFGPHVDSVVLKASRALGLLIRSFQTGKNGKSLHDFSRSDRQAVISTYCANVRSVLEYCSVIWGGAAEVHMKRVERIQHRFLMWLCGRCRLSNVSFEYSELMSFFGLTSLAARRMQHDLMFIRNVHNQSVDSSFLLECFPLAVPARALRVHQLFHVPYARVGTVKSGMFCRLPLLCNKFLDVCRDVDVWGFSAGYFKKSVLAYVNTRRA